MDSKLIRCVVAVLASVGLIASPLAAAPNFSLVGLPLADGPDPYGSAVSRLVGSLAEYSRWPDEREPLELCVVGPANHADRIAARALSRNRWMRAPRSVGMEPPASCDIVYIGRLPPADQRRVTALLLNRPVLTIAENDPTCRSRAMFCLLFGADALSFRLNIDAVSRSPIRVDARVLRLAANPDDRT